MAGLTGDGRSRERFVRAFTGLVQPKTTTKVANTSAFFQQSSLSQADFLKVFGDEEDFLKRYSKFEARYFKELDNQVGRIRGNRITVNMMKKRGSIDLTMLDFDTANSLADEFKREVMRVEQLFQHAGLPSIEMPSANLYRKAFKFEVDNSSGIRHPAQILLNSMILNFNPDRRGLESINLSRSNILGSKSLSNLWNQFNSAIQPGMTAQDIAKAHAHPFGGMREGQKILMFDTETTGVDIGSQVRSFSMREMTIGKNGEIIYDIEQPLMKDLDVGFKSPKLFGYKVANLNGGTQSLNEFIAGMEKFAGKDMGPGGQGFLDEATKFLNRLMEADKIAGHNINFDIKMITDTIAAQSGLGDHKAAQEALSKFLDKINQGDYAVDTLTSTRMYLQNQVQEFVDKSADPDVIRRSNKFIETLMAQDTLAKVHLGGSSSYADVANIALNTNLFELIEKDGQAEELFGIIKKGSHIAETDVHLQSFIAKHVQSGQLKIRALVEDEALDESLRTGKAYVNPFSEFGDWARRVVSKSSAITPTTNIADVQHLHRTAFDYLQTKSGARGVKVSVTADELITAGHTTLSDEAGNIINLASYRGSEGYISFGKNGYTFTTGSEQLKIANQNQAFEYIKRIVQDAGAKETADSIKIRGISHNVMRNRAAEKILDTGISVAQGSRIAELAERGRLTVGTSLDINDISDAMGIMYRKLGTGIDVSDQTRYLLGMDAAGSVYNRGIAEFEMGTAKQIAEAFAKIGDPFAEVLDTQSRVYSSIIAEATAGIAQEAGLAAQTAGIASDALAHTAHARLTSGMGVSYFKSQEVSRIFDLSTDTFMSSSKPMLPQAIFKEAMTRAGFADKEVRVGLSRTAPSMGRGVSINAAVDISGMLSQDESLELSKQIIEVLRDADTMKRLSPGDQIAARTAADMATANAFTDVELDKAAQNLSDFMRDRGLVTLQISGDAAKRVDREATAAGMILDNDVRSTQTMRVLDSQLTDDYAALGPLIDTKAVRAAKGDAVLNAAEASVDLGNGKKTSRILQVIGEQARKIDDTEGAARTLGTKLARDKYGLPENKMLDYYLTHKTKFKAGAVGVAAVGLAYMASKRYRESRLYNETLQQQPTEPNRGQIRQINQNGDSAYSSGPTPMDPLATAGVVGNMDRMKIGHSRMGNNKYNHLYGG